MNKNEWICLLVLNEYKIVVNLSLENVPYISFVAVYGCLF